MFRSSHPYHLLFERLSQIQPVSTKLHTALVRTIRCERLPRQTMLLEEGEVCRRVYFLERGLARSFYFDRKAQEITNWFMGEGDWMIVVESFFEQQPADEYVQLLEDATVLSISYEQLMDLYRQFPDFKDSGQKITEAYYRRCERRSKNMRRQSHRQRYQHLLEEQPELFQRAPQHQIASYLGMRAETLSRLRAKDR